MEKETVIVVALFCCGKSTLSKMESKYSIMDLNDSFLTSIKEKKDIAVEDSNRIRRFNAPPMNKEYFTLLKESIGKYDVILLPSKIQVMSFLRRKHLPYVLVYPENTKECMEEWEHRNKERGSEWLWKGNKDNFESVITSLFKDKDAIAHVVLKPNEYLSTKLESILDIARVYIKEHTDSFNGLVEQEKKAQAKDKKELGKEELDKKESNKKPWFLPHKERSLDKRVRRIRPKKEK